jgi:hypothetical protein
MNTSGILTPSIVRFLAAFMAGLFTYIFVGAIGIQGGPFFGFQVEAAGGFAIFIIVFFLFFHEIPETPLTVQEPIGGEELPDQPGPSENPSLEGNSIRSTPGIRDDHKESDLNRIDKNFAISLFGSLIVFAIVVACFFWSRA